MPNNIEFLLRSMDEKTKKAFLKYVKSAYCNDRPTLSALLKEMLMVLETKGAVAEPAFLAEQLLAKVYPDDVTKIKKEAKNPKEAEKALADKYSKLCYALSKLAKAFFVAELLKTDKTLHQTLLQEALRKRNIGGNIQAKVEQAAPKEKNAESALNYAKRWTIAEQNSTYYRNNISERTITAKTNLNEASDTLDVFYAINKLRYFCLAASHSCMVNRRITISGSEMIESMVADWRETQSDLLEKSPLLKVYADLWLMLKNNTSDTIATQIKYINRFEMPLNTADTPPSHLFDSEELTNIYDILTNHCIQLYQNGNVAISKTLVALYQQGLAQQYFGTNTDTTDKVYKNLTKLALQDSEIKLQDLVDFLNIGLQNNLISPLIFKYCQACIAFQKGNSFEVMTLTEGLAFDDEYHNLDLLCLRLRAAYRLTEADWGKFRTTKTFEENDAVSHFQRFKNTTMRAIDRVVHLPKDRIVGYRKFVNTVEKLHAYRVCIVQKIDIAKGHKKLQSILEDTSLFNRAWFKAEFAALQPKP
jgi:hypothetical protein